MSSGGGWVYWQPLPDSDRNMWAFVGLEGVSI
jgi:hypothetical protein